MTDRLGPTTLEGKFIRLEPLRPHHADGLLEAGQDEAIWRWMSKRLMDKESVLAWIEDAMTAEAQGREYAFAVVRRADGRILGSTRYMEIRAAHRGAEVGWTWYAKDVWGTVVNPEAKLLLLQHAFEDWGAIRMELKTDSKNERSRAAILKLGAEFEGILRAHRIRPDGTLRDTAMYSILRTEWPEVKAKLLARVGT